jgi:exodeoxyribonuclease VII large subunit
LKRGFALLRSGDRLISNDDSLTEFDKVEIVRRSEIAHAKIEKVIDKVYDRTE